MRKANARCIKQQRFCASLSFLVLFHRSLLCRRTSRSSHSPRMIYRPNYHTDHCDSINEQPPPRHSQKQRVRVSLLPHTNICTRTLPCVSVCLSHVISVIFILILSDKNFRVVRRHGDLHHAAVVVQNFLHLFHQGSPIPGVLHLTHTPFVLFYPYE